jgi:hypothetical protein
MPQPDGAHFRWSYAMATKPGGEILRGAVVQRTINA